MTASTIENGERRAGLLTAVLIVSLALHVAALGLAWRLGWFRYDKTIDTDKQQANAEQVDKRHEALEEKKRAERAELPIPKDYQERLREEEELKRRKALVKRVEDIRRDRDVLREVRDRRLEELARKPAAPLRRRLAEELVERAVDARTKAYEAENAKRDEAHAKQSRKVEELVKSAEQAKRDADAAAEAQKRAAELSKQMAEAAAKDAALREALRKAVAKAGSDQNKPADPVAEPAANPELEARAESMAADAKKAQSESDKAAAAARAAAGEVAKQAAELAEGFEPLKAGSDDPAVKAAAAGAAAARAGDLAQQLAGGNGGDPRKSGALHQDSVGPQQLAGLAQKPAGQLYDTAKALERDADATYADARAAELAAVQGTTFAEAKAKLAVDPPARPDLAAAVASPALGTIAALNRFRQAMNAVVNEVDAMGVRTAGLVSQAAGSEPGSAGGDTALADAVSQAGGGGGIDLSGLMRRRAGRNRNVGGGEGQAEGEKLNNVQDDGRDMFSPNPEPLPELRVPQEEVIAKALPGRRFTDALADGRQGWLFIDTWYVIGPWDNGGKYDFTLTFPPEQTVDFDATYSGKRDRAGKPRALKWQFQQTDIIRMSPPEVTGGSTYYAYTEVWCERDMDLLVACATDDAGELWVNGALVWSDTGWSEWRLDEGYRKLFFHKGFNTLLLRIDNGPGYCRWSLLLCPPGALKKE